MIALRSAMDIYFLDMNILISKKNEINEIIFIQYKSNPYFVFLYF